MLPCDALNKNTNPISERSVIDINKY